MQQEVGKVNAYKGMGDDNDVTNVGSGLVQARQLRSARSEAQGCRQEAIKDAYNQ